MTITGQFGFVVIRPGISISETQDYPDAIVVKIFSFSHEHAKSAFLNFSGLKSVFDQLRFRDGLVECCWWALTPVNGMLV